MPVPVFLGNISGGRLFLDKREDYDAYLWTMENKRVETLVRLLRIPKSPNQLRYFRGLICELLADYTGHTNKEIKEELKKEFLVPDYKIGSNGKYIKEYPSLADVSQNEMSRLIERSIYVATRLGVIIPEPHEVEI